MRKLLAVIGACVLLGSGVSIADDTAVGRQHLPGNAVATVGGEPITKADFDHWYEVNARQSAATNGSAPVVPDPPSYRRCIAVEKEWAVRRGRTAPSEAQRKARCRTRDTKLRKQTLALLIQSSWIEKEADALGIEVSDAQVERALRQTRRRSFGNNQRAYERFLRESAMTEGDLLYRLRIQELSAAITRYVHRGAGKDKDKRLEAFARAFQERWTEETECRSGFVIRICGNAAG